MARSCEHGGVDFDAAIPRPATPVPACIQPGREPRLRAAARVTLGKRRRSDDAGST